MPSQQPIKKSCLNVLKFSLCTKSSQKQVNYVQVPYGDSTVTYDHVIDGNIPNSKISKEKNLQDNRTKYEQTAEKQIPQLFCNNGDSKSLNYSSSGDSDCNSELNLDTINISRWHSTKLYEQYSNDLSTLPSSFPVNQSHKQLSSTIREQTERLVKKGYYNAPLNDNNYTAISRKPSYLQLPSQIYDDDTSYDSCSTCEENSDFTESEDFYTIYDEFMTNSGTCSDETTVFPSSLVTNSTDSSNNETSSNNSLSTTATQDSFNNELDTHYSSDYFVCILDYKPKLEGDIGIKYSDKVKVINHGSSLATNNNYAFVQLLKNGKYGYVPKKCLISLVQYLNF